MDPFHVAGLGGDALDRCRRRVQQDHYGHRGLAGDPLYRARRTLHTGTDLLTDRQASRLEVMFAGEDHVEVLATWGIYQRMIGAYRHPDRGRGLLAQLIADVSRGVPAALTEIDVLGRTLTRRAADVLTYFNRPGTSNGPTEAICECLTGWSGTGWSDGVGRADQRVTLEAIGPLRRCFSVELSTLESAAGTVRPTLVT